MRCKQTQKCTSDLFGSVLGQFELFVILLLVIAVALASVGWCRRRPWYRARITVPLSVAIAGVGLFWAVERIQP